MYVSHTRDMLIWVYVAVVKKIKSIKHDPITMLVSFQRMSVDVEPLGTNAYITSK